MAHGLNVQSLTSSGDIKDSGSRNQLYTKTYI